MVTTMQLMTLKHLTKKRLTLLALDMFFSGSAVDTLETFKEILDDIDSVQQAIGKDAVSAKIVSRIKNTMSDRHSAEKHFNELLHNYSADLLPTVA